jgi:hypothetical protein
VDFTRNAWEFCAVQRAAKNYFAVSWVFFEKKPLASAVLKIF